MVRMEGAEGVTIMEFIMVIPLCLNVVFGENEKELTALLWLLRVAELFFGGERLSDRMSALGCSSLSSLSLPRIPFFLRLSRCFNFFSL